MPSMSSMNCQKASSHFAFSSPMALQLHSSASRPLRALHVAMKRGAGLKMLRRRRWCRSQLCIFCMEGSFIWIYLADRLWVDNFWVMLEFHRIWVFQSEGIWGFTCSSTIISIMVSDLWLSVGRSVMCRAKASCRAPALLRTFFWGVAGTEPQNPSCVWIRSFSTQAFVPPGQDPSCWLCHRQFQWDNWRSTTRFWRSPLIKPVGFLKHEKHKASYTARMGVIAVIDAAEDEIQIKSNY